MCEERVIVSIFIGGSCFRIVTLWPHWPAYSGYHHLIVGRRFLFSDVLMNAHYGFRG